MEYYDESVLLALGAAIGKPVKLDFRTIDASRGRFARICIEIDPNLPVVGQIWFRNKWFHVEYEGLHLLCKKCGRYGHVERNCMLTAQENPSQTTHGEEAASLLGSDQKNSANPKVTTISGYQGIVSKSSNYGHWLVVSKTRKKSKRLWREARQG